MRYLIDSSALHRRTHPTVRQILNPLIEAGRVHLCAITELEMLYSARNLDHYERGAALYRHGFCWAPVPDNAWDRAKEVQHELARRGQHRCASAPDLIVAVTAERHGLTILHYDRDFETISAVTGQPTQWIVPAGSV